LRRVIRRLPLVACLLLLAVPATASAKPLLGIGDQKPATFQDARLKALKLSYARIYIPWDVLHDKNTLPSVDAWFKGAKADHMEALVTIARSRIPSRTAVKPTPAALAGELKKWRARWPGQVSKISTWNEPNLGYKPELVAQWWLALRRACPSCTVLGADILDEPNVLKWTARFVKAAGRSPAIWGLHAYNDTNTFKTTITKALLKGLKGKLWITETGGVVNRSHPVYRFAGCGAAHQTAATEFLLGAIAKLSPRIARIYLFNWGLDDRATNFDAALIDAANRERPALNAVRKYLGQPAVASPLGGFSAGPTHCKSGAKPVRVPQPPKAQRARP
jgi:hypothetical protein